MRIVLDTNMLVPSLINPFGPSARILDLVLIGDLTIVFDDRIMAEYRQVLTRKRFGLNVSDVADLLRYLEAEGEHVTARPALVTLPDHDDLPFLEVALTARVNAIVTGNARHYPAGARNTRCPGNSLSTPTTWVIPKEASPLPSPSTKQASSPAPQR